MTTMIRFTHPVSGYSAGEIAGFADEIATRMVDEFLAEYYQVAPASAVQDFTRDHGPAGSIARRQEAETPTRLPLPDDKAVSGPPAHRMVTGRRSVTKAPPAKKAR